ncbi:uncharacterized protein GGS25DRAFT_521263 [Hypoxylon fragiforme]|uniref:uncharacterized protein n=1 Tax=Hypoxylon fragiforme TaxID=63214 RepID=UPI0020C62689|nr:uncharacterized protein GGS25DRAFT_521263 [Hypoxylon fragiforme]KAI2608096.1 hypothetical protein GGS25DRAFT_521263 [Hypoxylon fragiforme]
MKRTTSGQLDGRPAKMARPVFSPVNPPPKPAHTNSSLYQNALVEIQRLQARVSELESINKGLVDMLNTSIKNEKNEHAAIRDDLKAADNHNAILQGEMSSINRPLQRRTMLRQEAEGSQGKAHISEQELQNDKADSLQLRATAESTRAREHWNSAFRRIKKGKFKALVNLCPEQPNIYPTPAQSYTDIHDHIYDPYLPLLDDIEYEPSFPCQQNKVGESSKSQQFQIAPIYTSWESTGDMPLVAAGEVSLDNLDDFEFNYPFDLDGLNNFGSFNNFDNVPNEYFDLAPLEPGFEADLNFDLNSLLGENSTQNPPANQEAEYGKQTASI